jgi:hypothetical protein
VGLVANAIEAIGTATCCLSMIPPLTRATGAPRVVGVSYPMGRPIGRPGDTDGQRAVLRSTLEAAVVMVEPGSYTELPFEWPEPRSQAIKDPNPPPPIAQLLARKPWLIPRLIPGHLPDAAKHRAG